MVCPVSCLGRTVPSWLDEVHVQVGRSGGMSLVSTGYRPAVELQLYTCGRIDLHLAIGTLHRLYGFSALDSWRYMVAAFSVLGRGSLLRFPL